MQFADEFRQLTGSDNEPFPWQERLYDRFVTGDIPSRVDIPTGLGKTSVIALWLLARQVNKSLPRRLVYVVNRRTVVDQTTVEVERYKSIHRDLVVSTLRGQFADNREWSADPSREAVICGTVDMIGSRLLFSGYGVGYRGKPLHAGFLGQDALIVHDEAHLEPAFQDLLLAIQKEQREGRFPDWFPLRVMELSATSRTDAPAFELTESEKNADFSCTDAPLALRTVWKRTHARKSLAFHEVADERKSLIDQLAKLALAYKDSGRAILIFVRTVDNLAGVAAKLPKGQTRQLTGTMRGFERDKLATEDSIFARFLSPARQSATGSEQTTVVPMPGTVYLVCTSAGEVGVNISADDLVCDLSTFESMAQRFGRVNRFGLSNDTRIDVVYSPVFDDKDKLTPARRKTLALLQSLPDGASPAALSKLDSKARAAAFAPIPIIVPTSDILFDAWSMTSIRDRMPGRPKVEPFLHGITDWEPPQTKVAWRTEVGEIADDLLNEYPPEELLETYPLKPHELLTDKSERIFKTLSNLRTETDFPIWIIDEEDKVSVKMHSSLIAGDKDDIASVTLLLPAYAGGLEGGFLNGTPYDPEMYYDVADEWKDLAGPMRERRWSNEREDAHKTPKGMKPVRRIAFPDPSDEDAQPIKVWYWYVRVLAADADARASKPYPLMPHLEDARVAITRIVSNLPLAPELQDAVILAAKFHDLGKERERWQQGIGNADYPTSAAWAKSGKRSIRGERSAYRHEFGSTLDIQTQAEFKSLSADMQDLVLHLTAAHHGRARPHFTLEESIDDMHDAKTSNNLAIETPRRFARLQRKYGRWGLAYLESLVRAADYEASRKVEEEAK